jgi:hypothetical protein
MHTYKIIFLMNVLSEQIEYIVKLARDIESTDPFDWSDLSIDEDTAYRLIATSILEKPCSQDILCATVVKLCVENLILNLRLLKTMDTLSRRTE